jgi:1,4-dihydroxy-6-naphthoate synthase
MELSIGISPCPNDTFIFEALMSQKLTDNDISFKFVLEDVETLNEMALRQELDITKLSFRAYFEVRRDYIIMSSGSALGFGCGPLLISKSPMTLQDLAGKVIAVPGRWTTANFLLDFALKESIEKEFLVFSEIENAVLSGKCDAGVIIHENRFTYQDKGLHLVQDLGQLWEEKTNSPIPLGGIAIKRNISIEIQKRAEKLIRKSLRMAFDNPEDTMPLVSRYSQEMSQEVMKSHIQLYVNEFSLDLGKTGRDAIQYMASQIHDSAKHSDDLALILPN